MISQLPKDLITQLKTLTTLKMVGMWNNQLAWILAGKLELFGHPAAFFAFKQSSIVQLGNGTQLYENLEFDIHILDWQLDAGDGTFEQNFEVFDLSESVFATLQKFQPGSTSDPAGDRKSTRLNSSHLGISYAVFCLKKKK